MLSINNQRQGKKCKGNMITYAVLAYMYNILINLLTLISTEF